MVPAVTASTAVADETVPPISNSDTPVPVAEHETDLSFNHEASTEDRLVLDIRNGVVEDGDPISSGGSTQPNTGYAGSPARAENGQVIIDDDNIIRELMATGRKLCLSLEALR